MASIQWFRESALSTRSDSGRGLSQAGSDVRSEASVLSGHDLPITMTSGPIEVVESHNTVQPNNDNNIAMDNTQL